MNNYRGANLGEIKDPAGVTGAHVYAAVAHWVTKIVMPVSSVDAITRIEVHCVRNVGKIVSGS